MSIGRLQVLIHRRKCSNAPGTERLARTWLRVRFCTKERSTCCRSRQPTMRRHVCSCFILSKVLPQRELLQQIAARLKPGAPFCLAAIAGDPQSQAFAMQMQAWRTHMTDNGISLAEWERFAASMGQESDPIPACQVQELMEEVASSTARATSVLI